MLESIHMVVIEDVFIFFDFSVRTAWYKWEHRPIIVMRAIL